MGDQYVYDKEVDKLQPDALQGHKIIEDIKNN